MIILNKTDEVPRGFLVGYLRESMQKGIKVELPTEELAIAQKRQADALAVLQTEYGIENPNSNPQLAEYALASGDEQLLSIVQDPRTGKISFAKENMSRLLETDIPFAGVLKRYKDATNLLKAINMVMKFQLPNGMVHPTVSLQNTNRISYTEPPLMNIDKKVLWKMVKPRNEGWELWSVDVKNQEPWIFAHLVGDVVLTDIVKEAYMRKESFYKVAFERVYGHPVTNEYEYIEFKTNWNALTYGATKHGVVERCKIIDGAKLYDFLTKLPAYKQYNSSCYAKAARGINADVTYFGSAVVSDAFGRASLARSLADIPIQGTGADILAFLVKEAIMSINDDPALRNRFEIYYTRHDEIIFMVKRNLNETDEDIAVILQDLTSHMIAGWVPFMVEVEKIA